MKQIHVGKFNLLQNNPGTMYLWPQSQSPTITTEATGQLKMVVAGTFKNLRVEYDAAQTPATPPRVRTTVLRVNGADSTLSASITDPATVGEDVTHQVHVSAGDLVTFKTSNSKLAPGADNATISFDFVADAERTCIYGTNDASATGASSQYNWVFSPRGTWVSASDNVQEAVAVAGALTALTVRISAAPGVGKSWVFAIRKNGVVQDGSGGTPDTRVTIADAATEGSWTGSCPLAVGDLVNITRVASGSPAAAGFSWLYAFEPTTNGHFAIAFRPGAPSVSLPMYGSSWTSWQATESYANVRCGVSRITLVSVTTWMALNTGGPGAGNSIAFDIRKESGDTDLGTSISGTNNPPATDSGEVALVAGEGWCGRSTPTSSPFTANVSIAVDAVTCVFAAAPTEFDVDEYAHAGLAVDVTTEEGCEWTAVSNADWITVTSGASGSGSGTATFDVAANLSFDERVGTLTIAGETITVTQAASDPCRTTTAPLAFSVDYVATSDHTVTVTRG